MGGGLAVAWLNRHRPACPTPTDPCQMELAEQQRRLINAMPVGLFCVDVPGDGGMDTAPAALCCRIAYANGAFCYLLGQSPSTVIGQDWTTYVHPDDRPAVAAQWIDAVAVGQSFSAECRLLRPDGTVAWVYGQGHAERDAQGQIQSYIGVLTDISARKQAEAELCRRAAHHQALIQAIPDLIMRVNRAGEYLEFTASPSFRVLNGLQDWVGQSVTYGLPPMLAQRRMEAITTALETGQVQSYEQTLTFDQTNHGGITQVEEVRAVPYSADEVLLLVRDVTDRHHALALLQQNERRFRQAVECAPFPVILHAEDGEILQVNAVWSELTGYRPRDIPRIADWVARAYGQNQAAVQREIDRLYDLPARRDEGEFTVTTADGSQRIWQFSSAPLAPLPDGRRVVMSMAADVTERRQAEQALRESEERYRSVFDQAVVGLVNVDFTTQTLTRVNDSFCTMLGYDPDELLGKTVTAITHPADQERLQADLARLLAGEIASFAQEKRYICKDGGSLWSGTVVSLVRDGAGQPRHALAVVRDISNLKQLESQRQQVEDRLRQSEERLRNMAANVPGAIFRYVLRPDGSDGLLYMSPGCYGLWEVEAQAVVDDASILWAMVDPEDLPRMMKSVQASAQSLQPWFHQWRITTPSGRTKWLQAAGQPTRQENGDVIWDTLVLDMSDRKRAEAALQASEARLRLVTESMGDLVCLHHPDGRFLYVTPSSLPLLGYAPAELIGRDPYEFFHPDECDSIRRESHQTVLRGEPHTITYRMRRRNGDYCWLETITQPIFGDNGEVKHLQSTSRDVTDRVRAEEQLKYDALHDGLTGLPNRSLLLKQLDLTLKRAKRHPGRQFAVLFLDLDNFKVINDSLGHPVGDALLIAVANQLKTFIREMDVAARLGGDEFVLLIEEVTGPAEAIAVAERILQVFQVPVLLGEREVFTSTSVGILLWEGSQQSAEELLRDADLAMYRAKQAGRGRYALFDPPMHAQAMARLQLESELRQGLDRREFVLHYQPIVALKTGVVRGFEALIRWHHPQRGLVFPHEFVAVAEETGLIVPMGQWILTTACNQMARWHDQFPGHNWFVSVNLSAQQLQPDLLGWVDQTLRISALPAESLMIEVTEGMLVENLTTTDQLLSQLRARGVHIGIDDFGTGYSSLSYLHRLPADALKIDRAFVSSPEADGRNQAIAGSIVTLSNLLELNAIAEGIETHEQLRRIQALGCELGQGYYFSKPLPATQASQLLVQAPFLVYNEVSTQS